MMKPHNILMTVLMSIILTACSTSAVTTTSSNPAVEVTTTSSPVETSAPGVVTFADPLLEAMIRGAMGKPEGEITLAEAQGVTRMDLTDSLQRQLSEYPPITNLDGLEAFTNLESLDLSQNAVSDISPLAGLTKLTALSLAGNPVTDVAPLAKLTNLKLLILSNCQAQDYNALSNLINLQVLLLDNSSISDVSPLASLTNLQTLYLDKSSVEDFSSLENIYTTLANKDFIIQVQGHADDVLVIFPGWRPPLVMGDGERGKLDIEVSFVIVGIQVEPEIFKCVWNDEIFVGEGGVDVFEG